jgi:preprotein translocase subunit SecA
VLGRPLLVGTTSVELSDRLSARLRAEPLRRLAQVMLLRRAWMTKNNREEDGRQIPELQFLHSILDLLNVSDMRKMARELDISFNPEDPANLERLLTELTLSSEQAPRLKAALEGGISHQVLNARKHTEESQIIAGAGAFGAVTIATNMAGRGVDIKLGGDLPESLIKSVNRVLKRAGHPDPYDLRMEERLQALKQVSPEHYSIYQADVQAFLDYMDNMARVKELGGLHVIGSERHEARRIDNQLRGRAARQGDPGSSRFYLSLEDELMRRFGGQQAEGLMQRLRIDDAVPMEVGLVSRLVEQSQTRVEGANFDVRKHLLEYDDVLNSQRKRIYGQRDLIFTKDDLHQDVIEMLATEVQRRVPQALEEQDGPWKLVDWLDHIQPTLNLGGALFPSFSMRLLLDHLTKNRSQYTSPVDVQDALLRLAGDALQAESEHIQHAAETLLENTRQRLADQLKERIEALDTFFEGLGLGEEEEPRSPRQLLDELQGMVHVPLRLTPDEQRLLRDEPRQVRDAIRKHVEGGVTGQAITRLIGALERRLGESLELNVEQLSVEDWKSLSARVLQALQSVLDQRRERLLGEAGVSASPIARDLESALTKTGPGLTSGQLLSLLLMMPQGARASFDKKTHRRVMQRTTRLTYTYFAARLLSGREPEQITADVLKHLESAQETMRRAWGAGEFSRLANARLSELDERAQNAIRLALDEPTCRFLESAPLNSLDREQALLVVDALGRRALSEVYRQVLLGVISELWVDYLTQMEALRVSIGLEAYAQRDPLVQYKSKASALFQDLLNAMRMGVISRMFTYRPRDLSSVQSELKRAGPGVDEKATRLAEAQEAESLPEEAVDSVENGDAEASRPADEREDGLSRSQKRRRRRH